MQTSGKAPSRTELPAQFVDLLRPPADAALMGVSLISLCAVGAALVSQHVYDMQPCPWCSLQRLIFLVIAAVAPIGLGWRSAGGRLAVALVTILLSASGVAAALWQHFVSAASSSCSLTTADRILSFTKLDTLLPEVFEPRASCADAAVDLMGVPYEFWSAALFFLIGVAIVRVVMKDLAKARSRGAEPA